MVQTEQAPRTNTEPLLTPRTVELVPTAYTQDTLNRWTVWAQDPEIQHWMTNSFPKTPEQVNEWLYNATHDKYRQYFSIMADGKPVGLVSLRQDQYPDSSGEIGIIIGDADYRSKKVGTKALEQLLDHVTNHTPLTSVRAMIKPDNEKSIRLFTSQQFVYTGDITIDGSPMMRFVKPLREHDSRLPARILSAQLPVFAYIPPGQHLSAAL